MTEGLRVIDHRRHTMRAKPGEHLSQPGVDLARRVGAGEFGPVPRYQRVVTSPAPRAFETAIAMGFAVDAQADFLWLGDASADVPWPFDPGAVPEIVRTRPRLAGFTAVLARELLAIAAGLPDGGAALLVSHGGLVELSAAVLLPDADHRSWGPPIGYAEGIRLIFEGGRCTGAEPLRVAPADYFVEN